MTKSLVFILNKDNSDNYLSWINLKSKKYSVIYIEEVLDNKWRTVYDILLNYKYKLFFYDFPCFINSDVVSSHDDLCDFIEIFKSENINFASPAINGSEDFFSFKNSYLRNVNYIPNVFFAFSKYAISIFRRNKVLNFNDSGSGIDWAIPAILNNDKVCIIDSISIKYNFEQQEKNIKDFVSIYNQFKLESFYYTEFSRIERKEEIDVESFANNFEKLNNIFKRPTRRANGCLPSKSFISQRLINATGAQWLK